MEKAYEYVLSKKSTFLQPLYNPRYRGITGVEYVGLPMWNIISELYDAEKEGKSEKQVRKLKDKYYSRINCSGLYSRDWGELVNSYDYAGNYVNTSAYNFAIENYKVLYDAMIKDFYNFMKPLIEEATLKSGDISFDASGHKQIR